MTKPKTRRDGWNGRLFQRLREARGRSRAWIAARTGVSEQSVAHYEGDKPFPSHRWRDAAALALSLDRRDLGVEGG